MGENGEKSKRAQPKKWHSGEKELKAPKMIEGMNFGRKSRSSHPHGRMYI